MILISFLLIINIGSFLSFDCSGIYDSGCKEFTYSGSFLKTPEERVNALNNFYLKYFNNSAERRNLTFELDSEKALFLLNFY